MSGIMLEADSADVFNTTDDQVESKRGRGRSVANMTAKTASDLRVNTNTRVKFKRDNPRASMDLELNLSVPEGTVPAGYHPHWFPDHGNGEIDNALRGWWGHVTDEEGVNVTKTKGKVTNYLMAIEDELWEEIVRLQETNYRASIGETDIDVKGVESYNPKGVTNKIKVSNDSGLNDPFA